MTQTTIGPRGYIIETTTVPAGFPRFLQTSGLAGMVSATVEGMYLEPRVPLATVVRAFERAGATVSGVRPAGQAPDWHVSARAAAGAQMRLRNFRAAEWLPTLPPAA